MINTSKIISYLYSFKVDFIKSIVFLYKLFYIRILLILLVGLNLFIWLVVYYVNLNVSQDLIILHYNVNFGVDLIGGVKKLYIIPLLGAIIILINKLLLMFFYRHDSFKFISYLLLFTAFFVNLLLLASLSSLYLINFR